MFLSSKANSLPLRIKLVEMEFMTNVWMVLSRIVSLFKPIGLT